MDSSPGKPEKVKRGYRACLHCRSRKAKCDLGDIDCPSSPPCSRCRRESRECVFAPSRRGGNNSKKRQLKDESTESEDVKYEIDNDSGGDGVRPTSSSGFAYTSGANTNTTTVDPGRGGALGFRTNGYDNSTNGNGSGNAVDRGQFGFFPTPTSGSQVLSELGSFIQPQGQVYGMQQGQGQGNGQQSLPQTGPPLQPQNQKQQRQLSMTQPPLPPQQQPQSQQRPGSSGSSNIHQTPSHRSQYTSLQNLLLPTPPPNNYTFPPTNSPNNHPSNSSTHYSPHTESIGTTPHHPATTVPPPVTKERERSPNQKRRRLHLDNTKDSDPSSLVVADMQNESDALHILALASGKTGSRGRSREESKKDGSKDGTADKSNADTKGVTGTKEPNNTRSSSSGSSNRRPRGGSLIRRKSIAPKLGLDDFPLIKLGIVTAAQVTKLAEAFFHYHHHLFPMVPSAIIPRSQEQLALFAHNERYLLASMVIIASRHDPEMKEVHDASWGIMRGWISDITCLGAPPTIGLVEGLLLLAENLPRDPTRTKTKEEPEEIHALGFGEEVHGAENRQSWMLIGMAIRCAYGLGIDKLALKLFAEAERTMELERARLAWTYCYLFDRHISLRLGKAFWSRGPTAICFQGFSSSSQTGPAAAIGNFPYLREIIPSDAKEKDESPGQIEGEKEFPQEDFAGLVQAYVELTQMMSNAHDTLYPNDARTRSLVVHGEYFKYIDELARSLDGFKILWSQKKWNVFPLTDAVWAMFYYVQLYICAFSFQAHVERASLRAEEEYTLLEARHRASGLPGDPPRPPLSLFPRGAAASPDARYIFQSIDAARELLHICVDSLYPGGALPFLPSRYLLWFTYAAILLLKALYSGAMLRADQAETLKLIDRLCVCLETSSSDEDHPAVRYGRQLEGLRKKLASLSDSTGGNSPTGSRTVPLPSGRDETNKQQQVMTDMTNNLPWIPQTQSQPFTSDSPSWTLPHTQPSIPALQFLYPSTPANTAQFQAGAPAANPGQMYIPPSHQQPFSDLGNVQPQDITSLGFNTLEDWFGSSLATFAPTNNGAGGGMVLPGSGGTNGNGNGNGNMDVPMEGVGIGMEMDEVYESFDLADFWHKVGPGEAQGGFPFR